MSLEHKIVSLLHEKIGFNPDSIGAEKILASVRSSLNSSNIENPDDYLESLRRGHADFGRIVDEVIVPETWFFRDGQPFELLKNHVVSEWPRISKSKLRCLSVPCSTGEEPFSIAMSLLDAGLMPAQFAVDGIDISAKSLQRARESVYGEYSFRGVEAGYRQRYFKTHVGGYQLHDHVRSTVKFGHGNLLDPAFLNDGRQYDIIFCRNLLIYFDAPTWTLALKTLTRLLSDNGILFMGHAEALEFVAPQFESLRWPCAFAYRKKLAETSKKKDARKTSEALKAVASPPKRWTRPKKTTVVVRKGSGAKPAPAPTPIPAANSNEQLLKEAGSLADAGKFAEAALLCQQILVLDRGCAQAYFLLGLISEAQGKPRDAE